MIVLLLLSRIFVCRFASLVRYLHPSDEELRQFAPAPYKDKKEKKKVKTRILPLFVFYHYLPYCALKSRILSNVFLDYESSQVSVDRLCLTGTDTMYDTVRYQPYVQCICCSLLLPYLHTTYGTRPRMDKIYPRYLPSYFLGLVRYITELPVTVMSYYCVPKRMPHKLFDLISF